MSSKGATFTICMVNVDIYRSEIRVFSKYYGNARSSFVNVDIYRRNLQISVFLHNIFLRDPLLVGDTSGERKKIPESVPENG